ncbi:hypothetical protein [Streptomyces sp. NPDC003393]
MPSSPRPSGQVTPARDQVNEQIRRLMDQKPSPERTAAYHLALEAWAAGSAIEVVEAA